MSAHTRTTTTSWGTFATLLRPVWLLVLALGAAGLAIWIAMPPRPAPVGLPEPAPAAIAADPAQQSVMGYIQAHEAVAAPAPVVAADPAQQSVMGYIQAHEAVVVALAADPAQAGVMGYIQAHEAVAALAFDPVQQSVMDYLRAHGS